jgi:hypothetical protein
MSSRFIDRRALSGRLTARMVCALVVAPLFAVAPVWSASPLPVTLPDMVKRADRIVIGQAVDEWTGRDEHGIPATITTFEVDRALKGGPPRILKVKQFGVTRVQPDGLASWIDGMPKYRRGAEYLLLLKPDSAIGFTMPVGAFQGAFEVRPAGGGRKAAVNGLGNANLLRGIDEEGLARLGLHPSEFPFVSRGRGPMRLEELEAMIGRLLGQL